MAWVFPESIEEQRIIIADYGFDPNDHTLMQSGGIRCISTGRIVRKIPESQMITAETARDYHEKYRKLRISTMRQALQEETKQDFRGSLVILGRAMVQEAREGKGISKVKAAQLIYDHLELSPIASTTTSSTGVVVSEGSIEALRDIVQAIAAIRQGSIE